LSGPAAWPVRGDIEQGGVTLESRGRYERQSPLAIDDAVVLEGFTECGDGAIADRMCTERVVDALGAADALRGGLDGAILHTDHGSVYTSQIIAKLCRELG